MNPPTKLRLSSPGDLVEAVPYLLGFHPRQSLVALALRGPRRQLVFTMRLDLPDDGDEPAQVADGIVACLARAGADEVALVIVAEPAGDLGGGLPHAPLVAATAAALTAQGIRLTEALYSAVGRWWSYTCEQPACCPSEGTAAAAAGASRVAAAATYAGLVALPSRAALEESLKPLDGSAPRMGPALRRAVRAATKQGTGRSGRSVTRAGTVRLIALAVDDESVLSDDEAARLIVGLGDVTVRDACCEWAQTARNDAARRLWTQLVRRSVPPFDTAPLSLLAWFAYLDGDATLAAIAVERCLASDPTYRLALLMQEALRNVLDPALLRSGRARRDVAPTR